jgi:hypothetical protein
MKNLIVLSITFLLSAGSFAASPPESFTDKEKKLWAYAKTDHMMLSLAPNFRTSGPVFNIHDEDQTQYSNNLTTILLEETHKMALPYLEAGDHKAYYALMVLGLTVPYHEGLFMQFRYRDNITFGVDNNDNEDDDNENFYKSPCKVTLNNGTKQKKTNARNTFNTIILNEANPVALPCDQLQNQRVLKQVIAGGGDGSDLGIMQISTSYWRKHFWSKGTIYSTRQTVRFGLNTVLFKNNDKGFPYLYANYASNDDFAKCLKNEDNSINYFNLIRGTWARYNGGFGKSPCRFLDTTDKFHDNDINFERSLNRILRFGSEGDSNQYLGYKDFGAMPLTPSPYLKNVIKQIVENFKNGTNNRSFINQIPNLKYSK